jgi:hypothetical protein
MPLPFTADLAVLQGKPMGESEISYSFSDDDFLGQRALWKEKYKISWCDHCEVAVIVCPECANTTCNGGGCDACHDVFVEFNKGKVGVESYLTSEEAKVYRKTLRIQHFILESLARGQAVVDFQALNHAGQMSHNDKELFQKELS